MKLEITCTRAEANHKQLLNCMEKLHKMEGSFQKLTKLLVMKQRFLIAFLNP